MIRGIRKSIIAVAAVLAFTSVSDAGGCCYCGVRVYCGGCYYASRCYCGFPYCGFCCFRPCYSYYSVPVVALAAPPVYYTVPAVSYYTAPATKNYERIPAPVEVTERLPAPRTESFRYDGDRPAPLPDIRIPKALEYDIPAIPELPTSPSVPKLGPTPADMSISVPATSVAKKYTYPAYGDDRIAKPGAPQVTRRGKN